MKKSESNVVPFVRASVSSGFMKMITKSILDHPLEKGEFREVAFGHTISLEPRWNDHPPLFIFKFKSKEIVYLYAKF